MQTGVAQQRREELEQLYIELEWRKCSEDFLHFANTWIRIESKRDPRGWEEFSMLPYQEEDARAFMEQRYVVVLKARQLGITTLVVAYSLWLMMFRPGGARILMLSKDLPSADGNLQKLGVMYRLLPDWMKARGPNLVKHGSSHMQFRHGDGAESFINSVPATRTAGAGNTADLVVLDEFGLAEYQNDIYKSVQPTTLAAATNPATKGAVLIMLSTARGGNNLFAQTYRAAARGDNEYHPVFHPWTVSPFMDQDEYDRQAKFWAAKGEPWMLYSEFPSSAEEAFRESGRPRFNDLPPVDEAVELQLAGTVVRGDDGLPLFLPQEDGLLRLEELPVHGREYVLSVDPASGRGLDFTVATLMAYDEDGFPYIAGYWAANTIEPAEAAEQVALIGEMFACRGKPAVVAVETQGGHGDTFILVLRGLGYRNLYSYTPATTKRRKAASVYGFSMARSRRPAIIDRLAQNLSGIPSFHPRLLQELHTFVVREDGKVAADVGCHDDFVMSLAIAVWVLEERASAPRAHKVEGDELSTVAQYSVAYLLEEAAQLDRERKQKQRVTFTRMSRRRR